ncbi:MAG: AraC family transcriptional regulator [Spirochaetaceae bacterium]
MDKTVHFLETIPTDSLTLSLNSEPFIQKQHSSYWSINNQIYKDYNLFICTGGKAEFTQNSKSVILEKGKAFLTKPNIPLYAKHIGDDYFRATAQHFNLKVFGELDFFSLINYRQLQEFLDWTYVKSNLDRYKKLVTTQSKRLEQHALFNIILMEFIYNSFESDNIPNNENYNFIFQMLSYIQKNYTDKDVLEKALKHSPYSHDYTSRVFRKRVGLPPKQFILESRLTNSRNLLQQGIPVKEISFRCGFNDELYFSRLFKKHIGISPTEFRRQYISH